MVSSHFGPGEGTPWWQGKKTVGGRFSCITAPHPRNLPVSLQQTTPCVYGNQLTSLIQNPPKGDFPGGPVAKTMLPMQGAWV